MWRAQGRIDHNQDRQENAARVLGPLTAFAPVTPMGQRQPGGRFTHKERFRSRGVLYVRAVLLWIRQKDEVSGRKTETYFPLS